MYGDNCDEHDLEFGNCIECERDFIELLEQDLKDMNRDMCVAKHIALLATFKVGCQPNKEIDPDGMLYYMIRDGQLSTYLFSINSFDPVDIVDTLEAKLRERFPKVEFKLALKP